MKTRPLVHQGGMALIVVLVMLVALTLLGLSAVGGNVMQERVVGNTRDANLAFQSAEAALRDAERDVQLNLDPGSPFVPDCIGGLCTAPSTWPTPSSAPLWKVTDLTDPTKTRYYGQFTSAAALPGVSSQPVYVIERLANVQPGAGESLGIGLAPNTSAGAYYRITVVATGASPDTRIVTQSVYLKQ